jgi:hypothetical protein
MDDLLHHLDGDDRVELAFLDSREDTLTRGPKGMIRARGVHEHRRVDEDRHGYP